MKITMLLLLSLLLASCNGGGGNSSDLNINENPSDDLAEEAAVSTVWWAIPDVNDQRSQVGGRIELSCTGSVCNLSAGITQFLGDKYSRGYSFSGSLNLDNHGPVNGYYRIGLIPFGKKNAVFSILLNEAFEPVQIRDNSYCSLFTIISQESDDYFQMSAGRIGQSDSNLLAHDRAMHISNPGCDL